MKSRKKSLRRFPLTHMKAPMIGSVELASKRHRREYSAWVVPDNWKKINPCLKKKLNMDFLF